MMADTVKSVSVAEVRDWIVQYLAVRAGTNVSAMDPAQQFQRLGLDSIGATSMLVELGSWLGRLLSSTLAWEYPTPEALASYLVHGAADRGGHVIPSPGRDHDEPIAVVGMACRFPGASNIEAFWKLLSEGRDAITEVPKDRWDIDALYDEDPNAPGKVRTKWGGFLERGVDQFDPHFFGISPREAVQMDPQQRLMLELAWEGLEDARIVPTSLRDTRTGVFFGAMWMDYARLLAGAGEAIVQHTATGQDLSIIPARVSYSLGLNGPSIAVNTACSSSLVAVHLACQSLWRGESEVCFAGGVNLMISPDSSIALSKFGAMAPDGRSKAFDARANGYVRGEGAGVVVLKRLSKALADGDRIYCVIRGSAVNNDGFSNGLTAPNPRAQENVLRDAYAVANVAPNDVQYVETHGTGTMLGDPIEAGALGVVLGAARTNQPPLRIGSVKTNIGHLEAAAGIAGFIKVVLSMHREALPPSLNFIKPNPHIPFEQLKVRVQTEYSTWEGEKGRLLAGISSFGFGGTNCHVVLEGRSKARQKRVAFVFGGQGSHWRGMGKALFEKESAARRMLERCERAFRPYVSWSLIDCLLHGDEALFEQTDFVQPAIFAMQLALAAVWRTRGILPDAVVGQSLGEVAAAHVAGCLSLEDAARLICIRSKLVMRAREGNMAIVGLSLDAAVHALESCQGRLSVAVSSSPAMTVIAGDADALDELLRELRSRRVYTRALRANYASHSPHMDPLLPELVSSLASIAPRLGDCAFYSTVTGGPLHGNALNAEYWARNLREPVLFAPTMARLADDGFDVFVEVDPHAVLAQPIEDCLAAARCSATVVVSALRDEYERATLLDASVKLFDAGVSGQPSTMRHHDVEKPTVHLFVLNAQTDAALNMQATRLREHLHAHPELALGDVAYSLATTRSAMEHRLAMVAASREELQTMLELAASGQTPPNAVRGYVPRGDGSKVVFVFPGQGSQWVGMGRQLYREEPVFRETLTACDEAILAETGFSVVEELDKPEETSRLSDIDVVQPVLFAMEVALAALWRSWGVKPSAVVGHSMGEVAAAFVAGALSMKNAAAIICRRSRLLRKVAGQGGMAQVNLTVSDAENLLRGLEDRLSIAVSNGPQSTVIAGDLAALDVVLAKLEQQGVFCRRIKVDVASHSPQMDPLRDELIVALGDLSPRNTSIPLRSTVRGTFVEGKELGAEYWADNLRNPVLFGNVVESLVNEGHTIFIEMSPHPVLTSSIDTLLTDKQPGLALGSLRRHRDERQTILEYLSALWAHGVALDWKRFYPDGGRVVELPTYPWQRERFWIETNTARVRAVQDPVDDSLWKIVWRDKPYVTAKSSPKGGWLILGDSGGLGGALVKLLSSRGQTAVLVMPGQSFGCIETNVYRANPTRAEDLVAVLAAAFDKTRPCRAVVHLASLDAIPWDQASAETVESAQKLGFLSALCSAQAILREHRRDQPRLWLITRGAQAVADEQVPGVAQAPIWGLGRTLAIEHPELSCTLVDLDPAREAEGAADLLAELLSSDDESQIALRGGVRRLARLARTQIDAAPLRSFAFQDNASYLITGGLGGLGLAAAAWMVEQGARHLILVSRRAPSVEAQEAIERMHAAGANVRLFSADVSQWPDVERLIADIAEHMPPLRGVMHAAGIANVSKPLLDLDESSIQEIFLPKITGSVHLHVATREMPLDFFMLYSSASAVLSVVGQAAYAGANAFLDAMAQARSASGLAGTSIGWGLFAKVGMALKLNISDRMMQAGQEELTPEYGSLVLRQLLGRPRPHVLVQKLSLRRWFDAFPQLSTSPLWSELVEGSVRQSPRVASERMVSLLKAAAPEQRSVLLEKHVREVLGAVLRLEPARIERHTPLGSFGIDSLMSIEVRNRLEMSLGLKLPATLLFTYANVAVLVEHLLLSLDLGEAEEHAASVGPTEEMRTSSEAIAIIGMACRFPGGGSDPERFFQALRDEVDAIVEVSPERWPEDAVRTSRPGTRYAGLLNDVDEFDASFFGISPREAACLDPQQRLLLEVSWEALEYAGLPVGRFAGSQTGVFVGIIFLDYQRLVFERRSDVRDIYQITGNMIATAAGRLSYTLDLQGPAVALDTACSSSLTAVHLACQSLRRRESNLALAGGVNLILSPLTMEMAAETQALSADGRCKTFDALANGFVRGEGCGMVVLKRLDDAQRDGDSILAVIRGSAVNQDGRSTGLTAPNVLAQQALLRQALADARLSASDIGYVETHGTGTSLGDPIEFDALRTVLGGPRADGSTCVLGALKTNVGHMESAAGVGGLIKAMMCLKHEVIPKNLHFKTLNPRISLEGTPLVIPTEPIPWKPNGKPRRAGVSSFGISGTNAHIILEEPPRIEEKPFSTAPSYLLPLSAKTSEALVALAKSYQEWFSQHDEPLHHVAYTASLRRTHLEHRSAVVGSTKEQMVAALQAFAVGERPPNIVTGKASQTAPNVVFVFPGQGSQWIGMSRQLRQDEPAFLEALKACDQAIQKEAGFSVIEELDKPEETSRISQIDIVQPVLFAIEVALAALWRSWGVEPSAVIGHSMGEVAAAFVAGALSMENAAAVICRRSHLLRRVSGKGAMALVELTLDEALEALVGYQDRLGIAVSNGPRATVIAGDPASLEDVLGKLEQNGVFCRRIKVDVASHSPQMDPLRDELLAALNQVAGQTASIPIRSTVTGETIQGTELSSTYWADNLRQPVLFSKVVRQWIAEGHTIFVEMSPHPILLPSIEENLRAANAEGIALASTRREQNERQTMLLSLGALHVRGVSMAWKSFFPNDGRVLALPRYPWQHERYWIEAPKDTPALVPAPGRASEHTLLGISLSASTHADERIWQQSLNTSVLPWLAEHRVQEEIVFPGAGYIECAFEAATATIGGDSFALEDIVFEQMLVVAEGQTRELQVVLIDEGARKAFRISSRTGEASWTRHASGHIVSLANVSAPGVQAPKVVANRLPNNLDVASFYQGIRDRQLYHGPSFQGVLELRVGDYEALAKIRLPAEVNDHGYVMHPALLDACLQVAGALFLGSADSGTFVPVGIERLELVRRPMRQSWVMATKSTADGTAYDLHVIDDEGNVSVIIKSLRVQRLDGVVQAKDPLADCVYDIQWREDKPLAIPNVSGPGLWLVVSDRVGFGDTLLERLSLLGARCIRIVLGSSYRKLAAQALEIDAAKPEDYRHLFTELFGEHEHCRGVVHLASLDVTPFDATTTECLTEDLMHASVSATYLAQAIVRHGFRETPRFFLVTRGAQAVFPSDSIAVSQAPILGLGRTIAVEHPELACKRIDLPFEPNGQDIDALLRELESEDREDQVACRGSSRYLARLVPSRFESKEEVRSLEIAKGRPYCLKIRKPGVLDRLALYEIETPLPKADEVVIEVEFAGLNFLDVLGAVGAIPTGLAGLAAEGEHGLSLGSECAGRVIAIGAGVTDYEVGDEVIAFGAGACATAMIAQTQHAVKKPSNLSWVQAATLPSVFLTAYYALEVVGRLRAGERVLIHAGAGGVGLAAIQWAQYVGAEVFATAGNEEKRAYLYSLGVKHVFDSRSLAFVDEIRRATNGEGVDVVLNSLAGDFIAASLSILRDYGRFLEIGKRDYIENKSLGLRPFLRNLSFSLVDLRGLMLQRPDQMAKLLREVVEHFEQGNLRALPVRVFPISRAVEAFQFMAQAKHIGKVAMAIKDPDARIVPLAQDRARSIRADRTYVITGGLGGLGLSLASWLVEQGARHLVLVGRRGPNNESQTKIRTLEQAGAHVHCVQADVSREGDVQALFGRIDLEMPPLAGIVHSAVVLDDHTLLEQTAENFRRAFAPKALGAWHLHKYSASKSLDFFVLYSSAAALVGAPGQGNYCASNAYLDALGHERVRRGLPGMSIQWGSFAEIGQAAAQDNRGKRLIQRGIANLLPKEGWVALQRLLAAPRAEVGVLRFDARQWAEYYPATAGIPFFAELVKRDATREKTALDTNDTLAPLRAARPEDRLSLLERHLAEQVGAVLRLEASRIDRTMPLQSLGMDSLMSLELRNRLESSLGLKLSATVLFAHSSIAALGKHLLERLALVDRPAEAPVVAERTNVPVVQEVKQDVEDIAIVGMACRFPGGGQDLNAFWQALENGVDGIRRISEERWPTNAVDQEKPAVRWAGLVESVDMFDAAFFSISPREALKLDPQQRLLLEVSWEALENAGQVILDLMGSRTGVFLGMCNSDYQLRALEAPPYDNYSGLGSMLSTAAGRISYTLGFEGPCATMDTACSSSLTAVHFACQSLRTGESDMALAGGVNLILAPSTMMMVVELQALSPDGRCRSFDAQANGFVRGEGCGMVVLKRLSDATRDGDRILALIRGSVINQDGRSTGLTVPNVLSQQAMLRRALTMARLKAEDIGYVETHGTGTSLGDPIEFEALREVIGKVRQDGSRCVLGALKTNVGHMEGAAGIGGLIKAVLCLEHEAIPKNLHFKTLNPRISLDGTPFVIPTETIPWKSNGKPRRAGVSSFGVSGTNAHVIVEEGPRQEKPTLSQACSLYLLPLSAKTQPALEAMAKSYQEWLVNSDEPLDDFVYTASLRRSHWEHRLCVVGSTKEDFTAALAAFARGDEPPNIVTARAPQMSPKVVFVFPGQGSQWVGMGQQLYREEPVFREAIAACDEAIRKEAGFSILEELVKSQETSRLDATIVAQPALFAIEVALAALLQSWGIRPSAVIGHSVGEIAAAHIAGILDLAQASRLVSIRARVMERATGHGKMVSVALDEQSALHAIAGFERHVGIAAVNDPNSVVLSGDIGPIDAIVEKLSSQGVQHRSLRVNYAFHSPQMDAFLEDFVHEVGPIDAKPGLLPMLSTVTGKPLDELPADTQYWAQNIRQTVRFAAATSSLSSSGPVVFVEVGPHPVLSISMQQTLAATNMKTNVVSTLRRAADERKQMLTAFGALHTSGCAVNWKAFYPHGGRIVSLPTYPWQRQRYWLELTKRPTEAPIRTMLEQLLADRGLSDAARAALPELLAALSAKEANAGSPSQWFYSLVWREKPELREGQGVSGLWVVLADAGRERDDLVAALERAGGTAKTAKNAEELASMLTQHSGVRGVVLAPRHNGPGVEYEALAMLQVLARVSSGGPRAYLLTRGAVVLGDADAPACPEQAVLWGLGRVFALEHPHAWGGLIDLPSDARTEGEAHWIATLLSNSTRHEDQVALRADRVFVPRIVHVRPTEGLQRRFATKGTVLVTGGLGGLGFQVASWLARQGVRNLALVGRRGLEAPGADAAVAALQALGATVRVAAADVADSATMHAFLEALPDEAPLTAVFHAAGVSDTTALAELTDTRLAEVLHAKREGTRVLEELTRGYRLDAFVCFSSVASVWGAGRHAAYAAANAFLDAWAHAARTSGRPVLSISWGPWAGDGMGSDATVRAELTRRGLRAFAPQKGLEALELALSKNDVHLVVADVDWTSFRAGFEAWGTRLLLAELEQAPAMANAAPTAPMGPLWMDRLAALLPTEREGHLRAWLVDECAAVLGHPSGTQLDTQVGFFDLGMDSLAAVALNKRLERGLGVRISVSVIFDHPNIDALTAKLLEELGLLSPSHTPNSALVTEDIEQASSYSGSDEDALRFIMEKYEALS